MIDYRTRKIDKTLITFIGLVLIMGISYFGEIGSNIWSSKYVHNRFDDQSTFNQSGDIPGSHQRAHIWLARDAIEVNNLDYATSLLSGSEIVGVHKISLEGTIAYLSGDLDQALQYWLEVNDYNSINKVAEAAVAEKEYEAAWTAYEALYNIDAEFGTYAYVNFLATIVHESELAEKVIRRSLEEYPLSVHNASWLRLLGEVLIDQKKWAEAEDAYYLLLDRNSNSLEAYRGLANVSYLCGKGITESLDYLDLAILIAPENAVLYHDKAGYLVEEGLYDQADHWFEEALKLNPDSKWWLLEYANNARIPGNLSIAQERYLTVISKYPDWPDVYYELSWNYKLLNRTDKAMETIDQALEVQGGDNFWFYLRAGVIYEWAGNIDQAIMYYMKASSLDPENSDVQGAINRLLNR